MNKLFNGMLPFEMVMMIMGAVVFLALVFLLIWNVMKQRAIVSLLPFFLLPVIMVGFPSISSIKYNSGVLEVEKYAKAVDQDPTDTTASKQLKEAVMQLKSKNRLYQNGRALVAVAHAQLALGKYDSASLYLNKAGEVDPDSKEVTDLQQALSDKIRIRENFSRDIAQLKNQIFQLKQSPGDTQSLKTMVHTLSVIQVPAYAHPNEIVTIAKSYAITGGKQQSLTILDHVGKTPVGSAVGIQGLQDSIQSDAYQKQFFNHQMERREVPAESRVNKDLLRRTRIN